MRSRCVSVTFAFPRARLSVDRSVARVPGAARRKVCAPTQPTSPRKQKARRSREKTAGAIFSGAHGSHDEVTDCFSIRSGHALTRILRRRSKYRRIRPPGWQRGNRPRYLFITVENRRRSPPRALAFVIDGGVAPRAADGERIHPPALQVDLSRPTLRQVHLGHTRRGRRQRQPRSPRPSRPSGWPSS